MAGRETIPVSELEDIFDGVEPTPGFHVVRTVVGDLGKDRLARIRRVTQRTMEGESQHRSYEVDLVTPYRFPEIKIVMSALWQVTPQLALQREVLAESKNDERVAIFHPSSHPPIEKPEDIFTWYDKLSRKLTPGVTPNPEPNIYTARGMEELIKYGEFKGVVNE